MQEESAPRPTTVLQIDLHTGYAETAAVSDFMEAGGESSLGDEGYERVQGGQSGPHGGGDAVVYMGDGDMWVLIY